MEYSLAKKLKDAGFPQKNLLNECSDCSCFDWYDEDGHLWNTREMYPDDWIENTYRPTLSELIEACGERFATLENITDGETKDHFWIVRPYWIDENHPAQHVTGSTPSEAVANLWLALNSK